VFIVCMCVYTQFCMVCSTGYHVLIVCMCVYTQFCMVCSTGYHVFIVCMYVYTQFCMVCSTGYRVFIVCVCVHTVLYGLFNWVSCVHSLCVCVSTQFCMVCSTGYHVFRCHSEEANLQWLALDMTGISVGILGCYLPAIHYGFYCLSVSCTCLLPVCIHLFLLV